MDLREAIWIGDSKAKLKEFPQHAQKDIGDALFIAQAGSMSPAAKPFKGIGSGFLRYERIIGPILIALYMQ